MSAATARELQQAASAWERGRLVGALYPLAWLLVAGASQLFARDPLFAVAAMVLFVLAAVARGLPPPALVYTAVRRRQIVCATVRLLTPLLWVGALALLQREAAFEPAARIAVLAGIVLATAEAHAGSVRWPLAAIAVGAAYLPALAAASYEADVAPWLYALVAYLVYLAAVIVRGQRDQRLALALGDDLRRQRDLTDQQSRIDGLTGLCNRREFRVRCDGEIERALEDGRPLSLLILDLDHFKHVNGEYGHATGDAALAALADRIRVRFGGARDVVARLGGEEFAVLLPERSEGEAALLAEALLADLRGRPLDAEGERMTITASIGVGAFRPADHPDVDALLGAVDRAMYRAKAAGRARVCRVEAVATVH